MCNAPGMAVVMRAPAVKHMLRRIEAGRQLDHRGAAVLKPLPKELGATWLSSTGSVLASLSGVDGLPILLLRDFAAGTTLRLDTPEGQGEILRLWPADNSSAVLVQHGGPEQPALWWRACQPTDMQPLGNAATKVQHHKR